MVTPLLSLEPLADRPAQSPPVKTFHCWMKKKKKEAEEKKKIGLKYAGAHPVTVEVCFLIPVSCFLT